MKVAEKIILDEITESTLRAEIETFEADDAPELPPSDVFAYNELRSCADLVRMYRDGVLVVQPEFQREFVWNNSDQTRFIDSLIKRLPIPSMCFSADNNSNRWMVVDGLQRISTIIRFLTEPGWKLSALSEIDERIAGVKVADFEKNDELREFYQRVENMTLPITVLRCNYDLPAHKRYLFEIFHRLNTGGRKLTNQEIRHCIYLGEFDALLRELDKNPDWRSLTGRKQGALDRFRGQEIILRFFAFYDGAEYTGRLARFLNDYMSDKQNLADSEAAEKRDIFCRTLEVVYRKVLGGKSVRTVAVLEALMVGAARNIERLEKLQDSDFSRYYPELRASEAFSEESLSGRLANRDRVNNRMTTAADIFAR